MDFIYPDEISEKYNLLNVKQFRQVCKAKSRAAADRAVQELTGIKGVIFRPDFTSETGNESEIEMSDKYEAIISSLSERNYYSLYDIYKDIKEHKDKMK